MSLEPSTRPSERSPEESRPERLRRAGVELGLAVLCAVAAALGSIVAATNDGWAGPVAVGGLLLIALVALWAVVAGRRP